VTALRSHAWWWRASAIVPVAAGVLLWLRPEAGAVTMALVLGVYALIAGSLWLAAAWREYRTRTGTVPGRGPGRRPVPAWPTDPAPHG
jgi:uncharacterized membrane protein HdeD (DUF308 family)